jgi:hypothetical protein
MKVLLFLFIILCSCSNNSDKSAKVTSAPVTINTDTAIKNDNVPPNTLIYAIRLPDAILYLQQWDTTVNLEENLGKPVKQNIKQLAQNSDTHSGSYIKELEYNGLKLQLFSPPQNGKTFWMQEITLTNDKYKTTTGITIGDEFQKVIQAYPELQKFPGGNENMYYVVDEGYEKRIEMEFENKKLKKLRMYYTIN